MERRGGLNPEAIVIDEISVGHEHSYWIAVSDLIERTPIWFAGPDGSEESLDAFYDSLPAEKRKKIR